MAFYKTTFTYEVLSEQPLGDCLDLRTLHMMCMEGDCIGRFGETKATELTGKEAADQLYEFGSEPGFFQLDDNGDDINNDADYAEEDGDV